MVGAPCRTRAGMVLTDRIRTRLQEINNRERDQQQALNKVVEEAQPQVAPVYRRTTAAAGVLFCNALL